LREHPLRGIELPREKNPRRPVMTEEIYQKLLAVADQVHSQLKLALVIAEGTGRRLTAWRRLRWGDFDCEAKPFGAIRWRAENYKKGYEQVVPVSSTARDALLEARRQQKVIGTTWVLRSDLDPRLPVKRELFDQRLRRAYKLAKVEKEPGSLWHALRRKWATERKGCPINDLAAEVAGATR
jgi:integrase